MKKIIFISVFFIFIESLFAQNKELVFPIFNGSYEYMTMKQSDDLFFSVYSLGGDLWFNNCVSEPDLEVHSFSDRIKFFPDILKSATFYFFDALIYIPITHEEAHRTILTQKGIGSISQPILHMINPLIGVAYVKGVRDIELQNLRDKDFPTFIRLHTAGNESDYCITQKNFSKLLFDNIDCNPYSIYINPIYVDLIFRDLSMIFYELGGIFGGITLQEESNELERDIVGDDVCGMIHHLFNPTAIYHRYFSKKDFSPEEMEFGKRVALKTLCNITTMVPLFIGNKFFFVNDKVNLAFNTGYCLAPFGDFIDENIYIQIKDVLHGPMNLIFTARQYQNKENWFPEFNITCEQFSPLKWLTLNAGASLWWQPEELSFTTDKAFVGGSVELGCNIYPFKAAENAKYEFGINLNCMYKTKGFKPEIMSMNEDFIFTAGISLRY